MTKFPDVNTGPFNQLAVYVGGYYACAFDGESHCDGPAHSLGRARNKRDFAIERHLKPPILLALAEVPRVSYSPCMNMFS